MPGLPLNASITDCLLTAIVYLRQTEDSRPISIKSQSDLENFAQRGGLSLS